MNCTNEESARFPVATIASSVWAALQLESIFDTEKVTFKEELVRFGYLGPTDASYTYDPLAAHFEIHIEQVPILEDEKKMEQSPECKFIIGIKLL